MSLAEKVYSISIAITIAVVLYCLPYTTFAANVQFYGTISSGGNTEMNEASPGCPPSNPASGTKEVVLRKDSIVNTDLYQSDSSGTIGDLCDFASGFNPENYDTGDGTYYIVTESTQHSDIYYMRIYRTGGNWSTDPAPPDDTTTRVITVVPSPESTTATSTSFTIGATIFVNEDEWTDKYFLRQKYIRNQDMQAAVSNNSLLWREFEYDIESDGETSYSTTTPITRIGRYTLKTEIRKTTITGNILGFFGLDGLWDNGLILATTTYFTAGQPTSYDNLIASTTAAIDGFFASSTASIASCTSWTGFSLVDCMTLMFAWHPDPMSNAFNNIRTGLFTYAPWGYVTRAVSIITGSSTTALPGVSYTFPDDFPATQLAGVDISFNPWNEFYKDGSLVKDELVSSGDDPKNIWEIFEPLINIIVYLSLAFLIVKDLTHIHPNHRQHL